MQATEPQEFQGHTFYPLADTVKPFRPGYLFYTVTVSWQNGLDAGVTSTHGLVAPADRAQYGDLVNSVLAFVRQNTPGRHNSKVVQFFDVRPHVEFRAVGTE